ncbi:MAG: haloacid dehalogenase-like hydrolase [Gemmataceae bacterium]|nr:haloacid dehalogenase-like hydrolase [Gemmata sp.]MDW8197055.1 haloacid dehalogenase-like hydrolase [Gemmataceae bacterium]
MPILLFDIDGTLIRTGGAGKAAMEAALQTAFGITAIRDEVPYSGRTDLAISRDLLQVHGIEPTLENQRRLCQAYLEHLPRSLTAKGGHVCPGVRELLPHIATRTPVVLGLLTGNVRPGAAAKLKHFGLWEFFRCGGFGDDFHDRDDVARAALASVAAYLGRTVDPAEVWVIGDTPWDVRCARAIGAQAVAVATGWHPLEELARHQPDVLLPDLSDYSQLRQLWE